MGYGPRTDGSLMRAYDLAMAGNVANFNDLVRTLRDEGFPTVLTDLRSVLIRRDLRGIIARRRAASAIAPRPGRRP